MSKRIILVANTSWSFFKFRKGLIVALIANGHEVILVSPKDEHVDDLIQLGASHVALKNMTAKGINPIKDIFCFFELKKIYKNLNPDIIFHYTIKPNIYGTLAAVKLKYYNVGIVTGLGFTFINSGIVPTIARNLYKYTLSKANKIWFLNEDDQQVFIDRNLIPIEKSDILNGEGVDCEYFSPEKESNHTDQTEFLFIGRLLYDKGIREYYEAARSLKQKYPQITFSVLGYLNVNNPQAVSENEFNAWVEEGTLHYYGSSQDVRSFARKCSCIVLPSYREGLSMVLLEGASMAKPLIASNIAGCKEVIHDRVTGFLVNSKDANDLAVKMETFFLMSADEREKMGNAGREKIKQEFSIEMIVDKYLQVISLLR